MAVAMAAASVAYPRPRASWDTNPSPKLVNPSSRRPPNPSRPSPDRAPAPIATSPPAGKGDRFAASQLWNSGLAREKQELPQELAYERWLPVPPKVNKPRSIYNAASLAYLGDCIYELYARRHFLSLLLNIDVFNEKVMAIVRCEAQDALLKKLLEEDYLTEDERDVLRWGKNISLSKTRTRKRAGSAVYGRASSLETLIGYLYLTDMHRLHALMYKLGFLTSASTVEEKASA